MVIEAAEDADSFYKKGNSMKKSNSLLLAVAALFAVAAATVEAGRGKTTTSCRGGRCRRTTTTTNRNARYEPRGPVRAAVAAPFVATGAVLGVNRRQNRRDARTNKSSGCNRCARG